MKKLKYILFDLDGTLTDPKVGITKSVQYSLEFFGIKEDNLDNLEKFIGPSLMDSYKEFYDFTEEEGHKAIEKYRERFETIGLYENEIYEGMKDMLDQLTKQGLLLAVASSKPTIFVERICEYFKIDQYFHHMIGSFLDGTRVKKEEVVEEAISQFGQVSPMEIIMVGDRRFDMEGAQAKGIRSIGVTFGYGGQEELQQAGADFIVDSVLDLQTLILDMAR